MKPWPVVVCCVLAGALAASSAAISGPTENGSHTENGPEQVWVFFPEDDLYPQYIADPLRPQSAMMVVSFPSSDLPETSGRRFLLRLGGRYSIARRHPSGQEDRGWQIDFEGGFLGQFDMGYSLDNIGWDGLYALRGSYKGDGPWAFSVATRHDSAHVGDEYAQRTGRQRIGYTREEISFGASWSRSAAWRVYLDAGWGYNIAELDEPFRLQLGVEHIGQARLWTRPWYAALDTTVYQGNDWQTRTSAQLGLILATRRGTNRYRAALELASGRSVLGEFNMDNESYIGVGWYFDF